MGAGITVGLPSYPWQNATTAIVGHGAGLSANEQVNLATANTAFPWAVISNAAKQFEFIAQTPYGFVVEAVCGAAITTTYPNLVTVTVDGTGRFIAAVKAATGTATKMWVWGVALKSTTAANQKFPLLFRPCEMEIA